MGEWVPEFSRQRPPFTAGNDMATTHGAYSPRRVDPLAQELVDLVLADPAMPGHVKAPAYRLELWALARAEAEVQLVTEWLEEQGARTGRDGKRPATVIPGTGDPGDERVRAALLKLHRAETRAASSRSRLGLTPASAARLGRAVAQGAAAVAQRDVAMQMAQLHELERQGWRPPPGWHAEQTDASAGAEDGDDDDHDGE